MANPSLALTRDPQSPGQRVSAPRPRPGEDTESEAGGQSRGRTEKTLRPPKLQGECDELPNSREQKHISKLGTTARNPGSREMKSKSKWAAWKWGGAEAAPWGGHVRLALMCLQEQG